jgi:hypothetical protein
MAILGILVLILGVVFLIIGLNSSQALTDRVVENFNRRITGRTLRFLTIGILLILLGGALILFGLHTK